MMLVGTSLGGCLKSILAGEVSEDDVLCIITRTYCEDLSGLMRVVENYHGRGNLHAMVSSNYDLNQFDLDDVQALAGRLYQLGKIHQPRLYSGDGGFVHPALTRDQLWLEIAPYRNDNPAVVKAYDQYKMLLSLTKDEN